VPFIEPPRSGSAAPPHGGIAGGPAEPDPRRSRGRARVVAALVGMAVLGACSSRREPSFGSAASAREWDAYRVRVGQRIVAANPNGTYTGPAPEPLLAIPVLEVELNGDGSIRRIEVQRRPSQAVDTVQIAIDAVRRAAPFGSVEHLPRPWRFSEVFLFRDDRRFKPRSLDG
jgi:hypothetical protein